MSNFFSTSHVFSKEVFKPGVAVKIGGIDWDGEKVDFIGLIVNNEGDILNIIDYKKRDFDLFIEQTLGSPAFKHPEELKGYDFGYTVTILEEPDLKEPQGEKGEPKKKGGYKLSDNDIRYIRKLHSRWMVPQAEIARIYEVVPSTISEIVNFVTHKDVK